MNGIMHSDAESLLSKEKDNISQNQNKFVGFQRGASTDKKSMQVGAAPRYCSKKGPCAILCRHLKKN